ncbi:hypothetical protein C8Q77DRAFT_1075815 [Trametes polyzona]|nr:hypothetical protein C8Q77DRAFT_1075815 [Trametes polyzona]
MYTDEAKYGRTASELPGDTLSSMGPGMRYFEPDIPGFEFGMAYCRNTEAGQMVKIVQERTGLSPSEGNGLLQRTRGLGTEKRREDEMDGINERFSGSKHEAALNAERMASAWNSKDAHWVCLEAVSGDKWDCQGPGTRERETSPWAAVAGSTEGVYASGARERGFHSCTRRPKARLLGAIRQKPQRVPQTGLDTQHVLERTECVRAGERDGEGMEGGGRRMMIRA